MANFVGFLGRSVLHKAAAREAHRRGWFDMRLGFALLRDKRVSILVKLAAIASGVTLTAILVALEVPIESLVGFLLPFLGFVLDFAVDGLEIVLLPLLFSSLFIRWFAPKAVVDMLRQ